MTTVAAFSRTGVPQEFPGAQNLPTQAFMTPGSSGGGSLESCGTVRAQDRAQNSESLCQELTGLTVREASISVGRYLKVHWNSLLAVDSLLRAALLPIRECTPKRLQHCMTVLVRRYPDPRGMSRWVNRLMRKLAPILDWRVVLAYARFADPAIAEQSLAPRAPGTFPAPGSLGSPGA